MSSNYIFVVANNIFSERIFLLKNPTEGGKIQQKTKSNVQIKEKAVLKATHPIMKIKPKPLLMMIFYPHFPV